MSHSTHVGFSCPPIAVRRLSPPERLTPRPGPPEASEAVGVGQFRRLDSLPVRTIASRSPRPPLSPSDALGVGHRWTAFGSCPGKPSPFQSRAVGVGHEEGPVTLVRGADGGSRYAVPFRVIPALGQIGKDPTPGVSISKESCDVLHEDVSGSSHANDVGEPRPPPPLIGDASTLPGKAEGLAGKSSGHEIGSGTSQGCPPLGSCADVVMAWNLRPVLGQHPLAVGIAFDLADTGPPGAVETQIQAADAGEEGQVVHAVTPQPWCRQSTPSAVSTPSVLAIRSPQPVV